MLAIDTSAVIGFIERQDPSVVDTLTTQTTEAVRVTFVEAELLHGITARSNETAARERTLDFYRQLTTLAEPPPARGTIVEHYSEVSGFASRMANRSGQNDRWIIAEAVAMNATVFVTQDERQGDLLKAWCSSSGRDVLTIIC